MTASHRPPARPEDRSADAAPDPRVLREPAPEPTGQSRRFRLVRDVILTVLATAAMGVLFQRYVVLAPDSRWKMVRDGAEYALVEPRALGVLLLAPVLLFALGRSLADLPWQQRVLSFFLRLAFLGLLGLALARPSRTARTERIATVLLVDTSDSVTDEAIADARVYVEKVLAARRSEDVVKLVAFAKRPRLVFEVTDRARPPPLPPVRDLRPPRGAPESEDQPGSATNLQAALELAEGLLPPGFVERVVVLSDGVETEGDLLAAAERARGFGIRVSTVAYRRPAPSEVAIREVRVPEKVDIGQPFDVIAEMHATRPIHARARLYQGELLNGLDGVREIDLHPGNNEVTFKSVVRVGGPVTYRLALDQASEDHFAENNRWSVTLDVPGRPTVLYIEGQPERASHFAGALGAQQFDVDVRAANAFPGSLAELERYDFFVLSDVPASAVGFAAQDLVEKYVRDVGGGFLFAGGEAGFGLGAWGGTPLEKILPVRMDVERHKDIPSVAIVLVIDRSGSMTGLPMEMAKAACKATVGAIQGDDLLEVIAFDSRPTRYVKMQPARYRSRIVNDIGRILPGGGTEIFSALDMAYQDISVVQARRKHAILLTDGRADTSGLKDLVQAMLAESITVTTVGLGDGTDVDLLRSLADAGGGRFHDVRDANSLPRIFMRETEMVARQAAVEEWFPVTQTGPADFLRGMSIAGAPLLHGYVSTELKAAPAQQILASDQGEPILARWRVGLGWTLAWTSDVKNGWAVDWVRWAGFGRFWGQMIREHMRKKHRRELDMETRVEGGRVHATIDAFTGDERFDNDIHATLTVTAAEDTKFRRTVDMRQSAPGRYEADFQLDRYGSFLLKAEHKKVSADGTEKLVGVSHGHVSNPYPREYGSFEPDVERLERAAIAGGGYFDPEPEKLFEPGDDRIVRQVPLWSPLVLAALLPFLLDLLVRRVRLFDRKFVA